MQDTDYAVAIRVYCFFFKARIAMDNETMFTILNANGLKDCATFAKTGTAPNNPTYDTKTHCLRFWPTTFDLEGAPLFSKSPDFISDRVKEARKTAPSFLRKSSFISTMRMFLEKMDLIVANKSRYASEKAFVEAKIQNVLAQYIQLLAMQDILCGDNSLRHFTLTSEAKAFQIIQQISDHPEINPLLATETMFVLR